MLRTNTKSQTRRRPLCFENLERREVFALSNGVLTMYQTPSLGHETTLTPTNNGIRVTSVAFDTAGNPTGSSIDMVYRNVRQVVYHGGDRQDKFTNNSTVPAVVYGKGGDDVLQGGRGNDKLYGGSGNDVLRGEEGNDVLQGDTGNDILYGDAGDDNLWGGNGNDTLYGGAGADYLSGDAGTDALFGQEGVDTIDGELELTPNNSPFNGGGIFDFTSNAGSNTLQGAARNPITTPTNSNRPNNNPFEQTSDSSLQNVSGSILDLSQFQMNPSRLIRVRQV